MTSLHRTDQLRVAVPTLEPDPVFLNVLAELGASSRPVTPRAARSAGLRMIVATASVAVVATATWAAGSPTGMDTPLSPADSPSHMEPSGPPSHGNVGTPQPDVSNSPGSPLSPGLPGTTSSLPERASTGGTSSPDRSRSVQDGPQKRKKNGKAKKHGKQNATLNRRADRPRPAAFRNLRIARPGSESAGTGTLHRRAAER